MNIESVTNIKYLTTGMTVFLIVTFFIIFATIILFIIDRRLARRNISLELISILEILFVVISIFIVFIVMPIMFASRANSIDHMRQISGEAKVQELKKIVNENDGDENAKIATVAYSDELYYIKFPEYKNVSKGDIIKFNNSIFEINDDDHEIDTTTLSSSSEKNNIKVQSK